MNDIPNLIKLYGMLVVSTWRINHQLVEHAQWDEAFRLARTHPEHESSVFLPYAAWLAEAGRFDEALDAFAKAGRADQALSVLNQLAHNAVTEQRFADAAYYFWRLATEHLHSVTNTPENLTPADNDHLSQYAVCKSRAELYHAYNNVFRYDTEIAFC